MSKEKISKIKEPLLILAPMAGYTDRAMRLICKSFGADLTYTEMVSAKAVVYGDKKTHTLARIKEDEGRVALQIFGKEPDIMAEAAGILENGYREEGFIKPCAIDVNMGCPVHKIYSNGEGSSLMKDPDLIYNIIRKISSSISLPVTVKMRLGVTEGELSLFECAKAAEEGGAQLIAVHGRYKSQLYGGVADYQPICELKKRASVPIIANGDIRCGKDAKYALDITGADGLMIGRAAVGNPFIFNEIKAYLSGADFEFPPESLKIATAKEQLYHAILDKGEAVAVMEARKQIALYFKGHRGTALLRSKINSVTTYSEVCAAIDECYN